MTRPTPPETRHPARLKATFLEKVWGSTALEPWFPKPQNKIGEVWFTADQLPVLVKFLFTSDKLSVQVHPAGPQGKTEMWHILRAEPGAKIALGFREPLSRERLREAARSGEIERLLHWFPVSAGETYFTPARTVHAIGGGIALCEIQQFSDVTYRLYDYGRPRELHLDQAVAISDLSDHPGASQSVPLPGGRESLVRCEYFETEMIELASPAGSFELQGPALLIFIEGSGRLAGEPFRIGEVWQLPAGMWRLDTASAHARMLRVVAPGA
ncbi:MAG TPA: class I mannose-6-phosphate isomerase [Bryobacteraceae bacterium]|nr:class I mannose-6-phosphate isomerase [Bryobacteraceae bacterium]